MSSDLADAPVAYEQFREALVQSEGESTLPDWGDGDVRPTSSETSGYLSGGEEVWWSDVESESPSEYDSEEEERLLQEEWDASVQQFKTIISVMLLPYIGKFYGRRFGYYAFTRYQLHGLTPSFFGMAGFFPTGSWVPSALAALFNA